MCNPSKLFRLAVALLSVAILCQAASAPDDNESRDKILFSITRVMGSKNETIEYLQPLLSKLNKYPSLVMLGLARNLDTAEWLFGEYERVGYDQLQKFKELGEVVSSFIETLTRHKITTPCPEEPRFMMAQRCLLEMAKCKVNLLELEELPFKLVGVFDRELHEPLRNFFPDEVNLLCKGVMESTARFVENGFDLSQHGYQIATITGYSEFTSEHLELFLEKGLPLHFISLFVICLSSKRLDLASVVYKHGRKIPDKNSVTIDYYYQVPEDKIQAMATFMAKEKHQATMQSVKSILESEEPSSLKLISSDIVFNIIMPLIYELEYIDALKDVVVPFTPIKKPVDFCQYST